MSAPRASSAVVPRPSGPYASVLKRGIDLAAALAAIAVLAPVGTLIAFWIKLDSRGPVFYRQERVGRDGRSFSLVKFRSMVPGAESVGAGVRVERADPRITRVGSWLRRFSLDELPQLLNVLRGDMSLVGPRPTLRYQVEQYTPRQRGRLLVRPGLTGWAQVRGRNSIDWASRIELDLEYVERLSAWLDLRILLSTIPVVLRGGDQIAPGETWSRPDDGAAKRD